MTILEAAVRPPARLRMGEALAELGRRAGRTNEDVDAIERVRAWTPAKPIKIGQ